MYNFDNHIIISTATIRDALQVIDEQGLIANVLFVVDSGGKLIGTLTDGDIRRGLLKGETLASFVSAVINKNFKFLEIPLQSSAIKLLKDQLISFAPVLNEAREIVEILDVNKYKPTLPIHAIIMAGGKGKRLMPLTKDTPKPLLVVGNKPIIEHNIDRLSKFGIHHIHISVNYLGDQLKSYFNDGKAKNLNIDYLTETEFLGTIASIKLTDQYQYDTLMVMNSDLLTNIDFYDFYQSFVNEEADMAIASTTYCVDIPYAVMETNGGSQISSIKEKPRYTYYSNAGIYLIKKELLDLIPDGVFYNVTDLIDRLLELNKKVVSFPIMGYWLDIGKHEDFNKAQNDIKHLQL
jgi:dTDP-glucose pyrophosphorylase